MTDRTVNDSPAFPVINGGVLCMGMTLREYFAAKAMQAAITGLLSGNTLLTINKAEVARFSMQMADAMLEERENK